MTKEDLSKEYRVIESMQRNGVIFYTIEQIIEKKWKPLWIPGKSILYNELQARKLIDEEIYIRLKRYEEEIVSTKILP